MCTKLQLNRITKEVARGAKDVLGDKLFKVILYGSYARGDYRETSDIDLLILLDINREKLTYSEKFKITSPIYDIGLETDTLISPKIYSKIGWARHRVTPYYENVNKEGIIL